MSLSLLSSFSTSILKSKGNIPVPVVLRSFSTSSMMMEERTFTCSDGFQLAAQCHQPPSTSSTSGGKKILALHGWLDNSRSFWKLGPTLSSASHEVVALDLPGHGLSGHRPPEGPTVMLPEAVYYVADVLGQLEWLPPPDDDAKPQVTLIGHSMGAAISLAYAAAFPEHIERLVLLEGAGPIAKPEEEVVQHLRRHVETRLKGNVSLYGAYAKGPRVHASLEAAIETRMKTATLSPGNQCLSHEAAAEMVQRATRPAEDGNGVQFLHDYRLTWPSLMYMTDGQVAALHKSIQCPTCLLLAEDGWPFEPERLQAVKDRLQPKEFAVLAGSHHFHADPVPRRTTDGP